MPDSVPRKSFLSHKFLLAADELSWDNKSMNQSPAGVLNLVKSIPVEIPKNVAVLKVERAGRIDRYGQPLNETVYARIWARLERKHRMVRGLNGDTVDIDAELWADDMQLRARDLLTLDNADNDEYTVFDVSEETDVDGNQLFQRARLVKKR